MSFALFRGLRCVANRAPALFKAAPMFKPVFQNHAVISVRQMANHRHKKIIKLAKGFRGRANRCYSVAKHRVRKARQYAYRDRKVKKREFRKLWIQRINAACRMYGTAYSRFVNHMLKTNITLNRKVLADLAVTEPLSFRAVLEVSKSTLKA